MPRQSQREQYVDSEEEVIRYLNGTEQQRGSPPRKSTDSSYGNQLQSNQYAQKPMQEEGHQIYNSQIQHSLSNSSSLQNYQQQLASPNKFAPDQAIGSSARNLGYGINVYGDGQQAAQSPNFRQTNGQAHGENGSSEIAKKLVNSNGYGNSPPQGLGSQYLQQQQYIQPQQ